MNPSRAAVFGAVLAALWAAHDCGDHLLQTDRQARDKVSSWSAMAGHVGGYHALQVAVLLALRPLGVRPSWARLALAVAVSAASHALLDRRWPVRWLLTRTGSPFFAEMTSPVSGMYQADQACHHGFLLVAAWVIAF